MHDSRPEVEDQIDRLLDAAFASYAGAETQDAGLTQRILARVAADGEALTLPAQEAPVRRGWPVWGRWTGSKTWAIAIPAAACLVLAVGLTMWPLGRSATQINVAVLPEAPPVKPAQRAPEQREAQLRSETALPHVGSMRRRSQVPDLSAQQAALPKLEVFPTPLPPSTDERRLAAYAVTAREPVRKSLVVKTEEPAENLSIAFIEIPPVVVADKLDEPPDQISRKPGGHGPMN